MAEPPLAVAVASFRDVALLDACLESVTREASAKGTRIVVARAGNDGDLARCRDRWPSVAFVQAPLDANVPRLRGLAILAAGTGPVALTEDHCVVAAGWLAQLDANPADVLGGAMGNARTERLVDWGAYFSEYGFFASASAGPKPLVTGANVRYAAKVVRQVGEWAAAGEWEDVIHGRLGEAGCTFAFDPAALVLQNQVYRVRSFLVDRFQHGYTYARKRLTEQGVGRRWMWALGVLALPAVLTLRVGRAAAPVARAAFFRSLGFTVLFLSAWAVGEGVGYLTGASESTQ